MIRIVAGVGIGSLPGEDDICELQKMYCLPEGRGTGVSHRLMDIALEYAGKYYRHCYLETLDNMTAAQRVYEKYGFRRIQKPVVKTDHFACDVRYIKDICPEGSSGKERPGAQKYIGKSKKTASGFFARPEFENEEEKKRMRSIISDLIRLETNPVAVYRTEELPENAVQFKPGVWGCVISMLNAAANGKTAAMSRESVACRGGQSGLGLDKFEPGVIEYFLSTGGKGPKPGEFYLKTPELAREYICSLPEWKTENYLVFRPLCEVTEEDKPDGVIFLVNADQISALITLASYDRPTQENVKVVFGSGCAQAVLRSFSGDGRTCMIGLTDPSSRKWIDKSLMSFSIPYARYLEMENNAQDSFLTKETWQKIAERI